MLECRLWVSSIRPWFLSDARSLVVGLRCHSLTFDEVVVERPDPVTVVARLKVLRCLVSDVRMFFEGRSARSVVVRIVDWVLSLGETC